jgi:hypothetical protein
MFPFNRSGNRLLQQEERILVQEKRHFPPVVDCAQWMARADENTNNDNMEWKDPYQGKAMTPYTLPEPAPSNLQIGLYGKEVSFVTMEVQSKSSRVRHGGQSTFLTILKRYKIDTTDTKSAASTATAVPMVLQVGGQIGWFSLQAAALGFEVHVLEENPSHVLRMCRNIQLNQEANEDTTTTSTTNRPLVLHLYHAVVVMAENVGTSKPSATTVSTQVDLSGRLGRGVFAHQIEFVPAFLKPLYPQHQQHPSLLPILSTTLDHWAESQSLLGPENNSQNSHLVLLKIDVAPGHETQVLRGAQLLLQSKHVWNIMVDIKVSGSSSSSSSVGQRPRGDEEENYFLQEGSSHRQLVLLLLDSGYQLYNQWDKTKKTTPFQDGNDASFLPKLAFNNNNTNYDATKKAVVDSIVKLTHQFCAQGIKGCHMWWKRGTVDDGP